MQRQLPLIGPTDNEWRLDERTKALGRRGISAARAALRRAAAPAPAPLGANR